ncbi:hypothetical protein QJS10_CPA06g01173 [Acorus calamus]|uniref:Uncharacterized protein n=1 Tax=Acorus calamus TaxID=4465 RepID=A0AAV9ENH8_ACOCL|nr:hypothetical protein QJS10_CPA06g01173 [Acorus calamus]
MEGLGEDSNQQLSALACVFPQPNTSPTHPLSAMRMTLDFHWPSYHTLPWIDTTGDWLLGSEATAGYITNIMKDLQRYEKEEFVERTKLDLLNLDQMGQLDLFTPLLFQRIEAIPRPAFSRTQLERGEDNTLGSQRIQWDQGEYGVVLGDSTVTMGSFMDKSIISSVTRFYHANGTMCWMLMGHLGICEGCSH